MNNIIAQVFADRILEVGMFEKLGGLVVPQPVSLNGTVKILPIGCYKDGTPDKMEHFVPNTAGGPIGFFLEEAGAQMQSIDGPKRGRMTFAYSLRFLAWYKVDVAGVEGCSAGHIVIPRIMKEILKNDDTKTRFLNDAGFFNLEVQRISTLPQVPALFNAFSFYNEGLTRGLFAYPYDYFGLSIQGKYSVAIGGDCFDDRALPQIFGACCQ